MAEQEKRGYVFTSPPSRPTSVHEQVEEEKVTLDEQTSSGDTADAARKAGDMRRIHTVYEDYFVSFMRVRYAWGIFAMLLCWLGVDIVMLLANATSTIDLRVLYALGGAVFGFWTGGLWGYACRNARGLKDIKNVYKMKPRSQERMDKAERNIQLRVWRSSGSIPICLLCTFLGAAGMWLFSRCVAGDAYAVPFHLSDTVLITLIGSTTASVIGIFLIVLHWLFPKEKKMGGAKNN